MRNSMFAGRVAAIVLGLVIAGAPLAAQSASAGDADAKAIENFHLTMPVLNRMAQVQENMYAMVKAHPELAKKYANQSDDDEGDFGISYEKADRILNHILSGYTPAEVVARGFDAADVEVVRKRVDGTHWKRKLPTVAMLSHSAIGESYLRPVDY